MSPAVDIDLESPDAATAQERRCARCKQWLPADRFYLKGRNKWASRCKTCSAIDRRRKAGPDAPPPHRGEVPGGDELAARRDEIKASAIDRRRNAGIAVPRPSALRGDRRPWSELTPAQASRRLRRLVAEGKGLRHFTDQVAAGDADADDDDAED